METVKRLGIFGGSFDPIHNAHLMLAKQALTQFDLDQIWFVPSGVSYHKGHEMTAAEDRVSMIQLAIAQEPHFRCSDLDISREGNTYTADTLQYLASSLPQTELFFLVGADSLLNMENWYRPDQIFQAAAILAARRPGSNDEVLQQKQRELIERFDARIEMLDCVYTDISSSHIRQALAAGQPLTSLVPEAVEAYIHSHDLYPVPQPMTAAEIAADLAHRLKPHRYEHTLGVAETARELAIRHGVDADRAYLAGLLHDCAKYMSPDEEIRCANMAGISLTSCELQCPALIHAKLGAYYAKERYRVADPDILNAIRCHTTGHPGMSPLEEILYIADYIEPGRKEAPHLEALRESAFRALPETVCRIAADTLHYLEQKGSVIDETSRETYQYYQNIMKSIKKEERK